MKSKAKFSPGHYLNQLIAHIEVLEKQKKKVRQGTTARRSCSGRPRGLRRAARHGRTSRGHRDTTRSRNAPIPLIAFAATTFSSLSNRRGRGARRRRAWRTQPLFFAALKFPCAQTRSGWCRVPASARARLASRAPLTRRVSLAAGCKSLSTSSRPTTKRTRARRGERAACTSSWTTSPSWTKTHGQAEAGIAGSRDNACWRSP